MTANEHTRLNRKIVFANNLKELAELVERLKEQAPEIKRDETVEVLTLEEYLELRKDKNDKSKPKRN